MGRSKFPGKPSKHCHRKRINVLPPTGELNQESDSSSVTVTGASQENKQDELVSENEGESMPQTQKARPLRRRLSRKLSTTIRKNGRQRNFISKIRGKTALKNNRATRNNLAKGHVRKDTTNFAGKFVLPTRSVHSSRVIKPNKRFIDLNETLSIKKKGLGKRAIKPSEDQNNTAESETKDTLAFSNGHRVILRQARLKLPNQVSTQGPFSSNLHNGPGTIICGVCGAVRYYRFVKQARKFNIYSCESCRKFIAKQIKRQNVGSQNSNVLICIVGQGTCYVPPVERSQHWKISKCAYRSRCPACWLKMCLKAYHLPSNLKQNLTQLLPMNMRGLDFSFSNSLPPILWQRNIQSPLGQSEANVKQRPVRFKPPQKSQTSIPPVTSDVKRQKIDLKGPRVKHVCRSASIVLGQPLAVFGVDNSVKKNTTDSPDLVIEKSVSSDALKVNELSKVDFACVTDEDISSNSSSCRSFYEKTIMPKKERTKSLPTPSIKQPSITSSPPHKGILLGNSHDQNLENRFKAGFSLITTKEISTSAMCFLCGSAGLDNILVCCICCEPYHNFCIEDYRTPVRSENDWVCMRCAPCQECKGFDKYKVSCPKCLKIYHRHCFTSQNTDNNLNMICKECTKCQDCGTPTAYNLSSFPGNLPLCLNCLDKKRIGKHCPICQHSFAENNVTKMLECSKCAKWVHADCEKLTSEQYDILKLLPISSNFSCSQCMSDCSSVWHSSVQAEMYRCFKQVLKLLIKNKPVKNILSRFGFRSSSFRKFIATKSLDIDNNNYNKDVDQIYSFDESEKLLRDASSCTSNTLIDIKYRLCEYNSVKRFNHDMQEALRLYESELVVLTYKNIFQSVFPWFSATHEAAENIPLVRYRHIPLREIVQIVPRKCILPKVTMDSRVCKLCQNSGDGLSNQESRLLYCGDNRWVHANCAYWSTNVFEQIDSHLQNVIQTIESCKDTRCIMCDKIGASIQCYFCKSSSYHFMCARKADFQFTIVDKAGFCSKHYPDKPDYLLKSEEHFAVNRVLFIEQHPKAALRCEPEKVTCFIGSLRVNNLGKIEPVLSDTIDAIIPTGFLCSRMFWSTKEPWKLVTYIITTSIQNPNYTTLTVDKNFTIDHSLEQIKLDQAMKELNDWRRICDRKPEDMDSEDEEEKNGTELLSPELTDTILEDLPHDILDGISVQDIFSNFSYEDIMNLDNSNTESITDSLKKPEDEDSSAEISDFRTAGREWTKPKSESLIRPRVPPLSLTVSYKVDSSHPSASKKRKISKEAPGNLLLLQVDGAFDDSSSECGSPIGTNGMNSWGPISEEPVTCEKCQCTYRTQASYKRHLDSCEVLCTSESDSENMPDYDSQMHCEEESTIVVSQPIQVTESTQPVLIQAFESYQSQVHTSVVNMVPEPTPAPPLVPPAQQISVQPTITITEPAPISISVPLCVAPSMTPQIVQSSIDFQQQQTQPMALQPIQQVLVQRSQPARREPMVLQQMPSAAASGFVPFVDAFAQPQTNQSVQYVQLAPQVQSQPQLLQIRADGSVVGILPSIQPTTVIVQQPQQLVLDSSGTFGWTQQPQPQIYYGFETIVQNTVMQSQQFLPTPVPGVLTANSSYSTTTQVFQTSKLEPVLDVSSNSFVLVNSSGQLEIPQQFSQAQPATVVTSQTPTLIYSSQPSTTQKSIAATAQNCINLPTAPFVSDQNIPMNVVPPIPKPPTSHGRPMSRVLPMPTTGTRTSRKIGDATKLFPEVEKPSQIKLDDKFVFSKDLMKIIDTPKARNRKFEILDYKMIKAQSKLEGSKVFKVEEKSLRDFEPIEKIRKLSTYEPLKEIEKVKLEMFEKTLKPVRLENSKSAHLNKTEHMQKQPRIDTVHINKNASMEVIPPQHPIDHCFQELENSLKIMNGLNAHVPIEKALKRLAPSMEKASPNILSPKILGNLCLKNYGNSRVSPNVEKKQKLITIPPLEPLPKPALIENDMHQNTSRLSTDSVVTQDKLLDMPQLDDLLKVDKSIEPQNESVSFFNIQSEERVPAIISRQSAPPLLSVKPQLIHSQLKDEKDTIKSMERKTNGIPEPKQPIRKELEATGAPAIVYTMENKEGFKYSSTSISDCWTKVLEAVQVARAAHNMPPLPTDGKQIKCVQITGLKSSHVKYLVEQLPGASKCVKYKPLYNFTPHPYDTADLCSHGFGAVRCQPHKNCDSEPYDMFSWLSSKHRGPFTSLGSQAVQSRRMNNFPMAMKFKNLKLTSRYSVGVYRSRIHGKGLFCLRDIEPGEMVIEYAGEVIRSILTDKREKFYNSKGIGCYMFRVDDNFVVDATMKGNAARFINHSCDPNCYSKVVEIVGHKHIIIFALRRILSGEELTYDYKFPFEEDKIPCTCGAKRCRKFLN